MRPCNAKKAGFDMLPAHILPDLQNIDPAVIELARDVLTGKTFLTASAVLSSLLAISVCLRIANARVSDVTEPVARIFEAFFGMFRRGG